MCGGERHTICKSRDGTELKTFEESRRGSQKKMSRIMYKVGFLLKISKKIKGRVCDCFEKKKNTKPLRIQTKMEDGVRRYRHLAASVRTARRGRRFLCQTKNFFSRGVALTRRRHEAKNEIINKSQVT